MQQWCLRCVRCAGHADGSLCLLQPLLVAVLGSATGACNAHAGDMTLNMHALAPYMLDMHEVTMHKDPLYMPPRPRPPSMKCYHQSHVLRQKVISSRVQVYQGSLACIRASAEPLLVTFVTPCVTLFQTHQHPACLDILATCIELFGPQPTAANMLTHALYVSCSASEPIFSVSCTSKITAVVSRRQSCMHEQQGLASCWRALLHQ